MADGFLGRWSRRKLDAKEGKPVEEVPQPSPQPSPAGGRGSTPALPPQEVAPPSQRGEGRGEGAAALDRRQPPEPLPTLEDVQSLTPDADFTRFVRPDVPADVKNSALKKLFADPRYNIQDGMDVYIGDYNKPDPLPESMLRQMAGAKLLRLFDEEEREDEAGAGPRDDAEETASASVAQSAQPVPVTATTSPAVPPIDDADPDLRLQQDDAAEGGEPGRGDR